MAGMGLAAVTTLAVALVASAGAAPVAKKHGPPVRGCATRAEGDGPLGLHDKANLRIGPVLFYGLRRAATEPLEHVRGRDSTLKAGIAVRAGPPVSIRIPRSARRDIALQYAVRRDGSFPDVKHVADGQSLVLIKACPPSTRRFTDGRAIGPWTGFAGGFVVRAPGCYPIEVARQGKPFKRRLVGFGERCRAAQKS
jgi:hypothetical protein